MKIEELKKSMEQAKPQFQPWLRALTENYVEKTMRLNPVSAKANGFFYQFTAARELKIKIVPDVSPTFIFNCDRSKPKAYYWGISNELKILELNPKTTYFCVKPYAIFGTKGWKLSPAELYGNHFGLTDVFKDVYDLHVKIAQADSFSQRIDLFGDHFIEYWIDYEYQMSLEEYIAMNLYMKHLNSSIINIEDLTGYSKRYCRKKFADSYSFSPKKYLEVFRFQKTIRMLSDKNQNHSITQIAYENGYFDESHFINDFKSYAQTSPENFRRSINGLFVPCSLEKNNDCEKIKRTK
ncbi:helix-turn-helix domain-containing protein [Acetobacterium woodii]|uniref:Transcriptional regulator AraC family n=1 Tax=Acetobacterium woodii (strain ATCC 29683 / DSM 1030 / JCM 2381 / KCTC 1655 / WB1) TaxID=931626 RepID=H6LHL0_ACEWD|nr:helix-turn-helix domain-containing protein [Acetobacterium woodii]AFA47189.1 transcriptional regulator AraC family [Acetobacterium woodii DSM 1030]